MLFSTEEVGKDEEVVSFGKLEALLFLEGRVTDDGSVLLAWGSLVGLSSSTVTLGILLGPHSILLFINLASFALLKQKASPICLARLVFHCCTVL